jgi:GDSL-like Lipase/Acylhydrolase family
MNFSETLCKRIKSEVRARAANDARTRKELEKGIEQYRRDYAAKRKSGKAPLAVLAEGDSWTRYIVGKAVIFHLEKKLGIDILNLGWPGDEAREMLTGEQVLRLRKELRRGPAPKKKYDFLLFSGGGNDLVGQDRFYKWLNEFKDGMTPSDVINQATLSVALASVELRYRELVQLRDDESPDTMMLWHSYDFAIPSGKGVCGQGPWMLPGLTMRGVKPAAMRREVVKEFLIRFDAMLRRLASEFNNVKVVQTQGTLADRDWDNELHPKDAGFEKIAAQFVPLMKP